MQQGQKVPTGIFGIDSPAGCDAETSGKGCHEHTDYFHGKISLSCANHTVSTQCPWEHLHWFLPVKFLPGLCISTGSLAIVSSWIR